MARKRGEKNKRKTHTKYRGQKTVPGPPPDLTGEAARHAMSILSWQAPPPPGYRRNEEGGLEIEALFNPLTGEKRWMPVPEPDVPGVGSLVRYGKMPRARPKDVLRIAKEYLKERGAKEDYRFAERYGPIGRTLGDIKDQFSRRSTKSAGKSAARKAERIAKTREAKFKRDIKETERALKKMEEGSDKIAELANKIPDLDLGSKKGMEKFKELQKKYSDFVRKRDELRLRNLQLKAQAHAGGFPWAKDEWEIYRNKVFPPVETRTDRVRRMIDEAMARDKQAMEAAEGFIEQNNLSGKEADAVRRSIRRLGGFKGARFYASEAEKAIKDLKKGK